MSDPADAPRSDPFVSVLTWLLHRPDGGDGRVSLLSTRSGVAERTLRAWLGGRYPRQRTSLTVDALHLWALKSVAGYPPPTGSLVDLAGPSEPTPTAPRRTRPSSRRPSRRVLVSGAAALAGVAVVVVVAGLIAGWWTGGPDTRDPSGQGRGGETPTVTETAANHRGSPVYRDPQGATVGGDVPSRIPYGTVVRVVCHAPNRTGQASVTALYLLRGGRWDGLYAVSDTFTNGDPFGSAGPTTVDPQVPSCPASTTSP